MTTAESQQVTEVFQQVQSWPPKARKALAKKLLESLDNAVISVPAKSMPLDEVIGLVKTSSPAPNDQQCEQIVAEERSRRFG